MTDGKIRLQKFMAESGVASRRKSEELIVAGKVKVNGKVASIGDKVDP
ncbi:MAG: S4 domain-containing protein, partial [Oscillospiraceae bacterium]